MKRVLNWDGAFCLSVKAFFPSHNCLDQDQQSLLKTDPRPQHRIRIIIIVKYSEICRLIAPTLLPWFQFLTMTCDVRVHCNKPTSCTFYQCCGSGIIYSGSGSNPCHLSILGNYFKNHLKFNNKESTNYLPFSISYYRYEYNPDTQHCV